MSGEDLAKNRALVNGGRGPQPKTPPTNPVEAIKKAASSVKKGIENIKTNASHFLFGQENRKQVRPGYRYVRGREIKVGPPAAFKAGAQAIDRTTKAYRTPSNGVGVGY